MTSGAGTPTGPAAAALLARLNAFLLPGGEAPARGVARVRLTEKGEIRSAPNARWIPFTAEETVEAGRSGFVWTARLRAARVVPTVVIDAYEEGHGRLVVRIGGALPVVNLRGPDVDKGEIQRYFANIMLCPEILVVHPTLAWTAIDESTLRVRDAADPTGATVDLDPAEGGRGLRIRADRPRTVGKRVVLTPWSAGGEDYREWEGLRVPARFDAAWHLPDGVFTYYRAEVTSRTVER